MSSVTGYNDTSIADDGTKTAANKVTYASILTNLTDPLKDFIEANVSVKNTSNAAPTATDDGADGYEEGSVWVDTSTGIIYTCVDPSNGAALWLQSSFGISSQAEAEAGTNNTKVITPLRAAQAIAALAPDSLPKNYITGLILSNDTDTDHDIQIAVGECRDSTDAYNLSLTSVITKQIDATWAAGDDAGGLFSGTVAADTWYHVFLIRKDSDGSIDAGFDTSITAANIPSGYTAYRRLRSELTDASANIIATKSFELGRSVWVDYDDPSTDLGFDASAVTTGTAFTATVPPMECIVIGRIHVDDTDASCNAAIYANGLTEQESHYLATPSGDAGILAGASTGTNLAVSKMVRCNSSGQLYLNVSLGGNADWQTLGYIDPR